MSHAWSASCPHIAACVVAVLTVVACGTDESSGDAAIGTVTSTAATTPAPVDVATDGTLPLAAEALDDPEVTSVATDLAPSQVIASTVPAPEMPGQCVLDDLRLWTSQVHVGARTVDAVIRIRHVAPTWCEADVGRSPLLDPSIEPDVRLDPGGEADLVIGQQADDCQEPAALSVVQIGVGSESALVPTALVTCGWWLETLAPLETPEQRCDPSDLETRSTGSAIVIRTTGPPCALGGVESVVDAPVDDHPTPTTPVVVLYPGDIAMIAATTGPTCGDEPRSASLTFTGTGQVVVEEVPCDMRFWFGPVRSWFGTEFDPLADPAVRDMSSGSWVEALDPFRATQ